MPDPLARLRAGTVDFAALLVVWLLASVTVGSAVSAVFGLAVRTQPLQTPLLVPAAAFTRGAGIAPAALSLASTAAAGWLVFSGGGGRLPERARTVQGRLTR